MTTTIRVVEAVLLLKLLAGIALVASGAAAIADCSRPVSVPAAPTGFSVITSGDKVTGVYPDVLRELGSKAGCSFNFPVVPRARADHMFFKTSEADILIPASRSTERDKTATFVPLIQVSPTLISLKTRQLGINSVKQLLENRALRGALVRTFSYGDEYQALLLELDKDKRIDYVTDLNIAARMLAAGRVDFTIVAPTLMFSSLGENPMTVDLNDKLQYVNLDGLKRIDSGAYLSRTSLDPADQETLRKLLSESARGEVLWNAFVKYYPPEVLRGVVTRKTPRDN
jgi:polar amino acid transport system substrate-binding protein